MLGLNITPQQLFDNAALGIIGQGGKACMGSGGCLAMSADGESRCAIGWSCTDLVAGTALSEQWNYLTDHGDKKELFGLDEYTLGEHLRMVHDEILIQLGFRAWQEHMSSIAEAFNLDDSAVYFVPVEQHEHN